VRGIKTAAAIWITGAVGLAVATAFWPLGLSVGIATAVILWGADMFPVMGARQQEPRDDTNARSYGKDDKP
jgi:putative Mg2+ transporter-C (MgtC) family protein